MGEHRHMHGEAFHLMRYEGAGGRREWIWNSRDGVTPFCVVSRDGVEMQHGNWHLDRYEPRYVPKVGERVFVDMTEELARPYAADHVERYWDHAEYPMREMYASKDEAVDAVVTQWVSSSGGHAPHIVTVSPALHEMFKARAATGAMERGANA